MEVAAGALLIVSLAVLVAVGAGILTGRLVLSPFVWAFLLLPPLAFGQALWNSARSRRATQAKQRSERFFHAAAQVAIGVYFEGQFIYTWYYTDALAW
ncbi:hypothetical protein MB27_11795 [Actinoplanes utahensis]|uniref:Uncharacterized protein n=1 Tax=Actinoplanes utahensis TaxID=1869 RepID=A0A0A6UPP5_ACTUT|nr:hypothetical protein MB27_11795 [Actinoplanes utahensis]